MEISFTCFYTKLLAKGKALKLLQNTVQSINNVKYWKIGNPFMVDVIMGSFRFTDLSAAGYTLIWKMNIHSKRVIAQSSLLW